MMNENAEEPAVEVKYETYIGSKAWEGFKRSTTGSLRHYKARCQYCLVEMNGKPAILNAHRTKCLQTPEEIKKRHQTQCDRVDQPTKKVKSVKDMFGETERSQEDSDYLMGMSIITCDVPYR